MEHNASWEYYPCLVDEAAASISVDLAWADRAPVDGLTQVYAVHLPLRTPGEHGMGTADEAERVWPIEDALVERTTKLGWAYVGRLRNLGRWQLTFYGPAGKDQVFEAVIVDVLDGLGQPFTANGGPDPDWDYYASFLYPDEERLRWILDRQLVAQLEEAGDVHEQSRPVDHRLTFDDADGGRAFVAAVEARGFAAATSQEGARLVVDLVRDDPVTLDHIHTVVMELVALADHGDGIYDGWGCPVQRAP